MSKNKSQDIVAKSAEERKARQFRALKLYAAGKITPNQAIDLILDMEKVIYIGNALNQKPVKRKEKNGG